jgi:hypothetical protein
MGKIIRLTESDLTRLIKQIVKEGEKPDTLPAPFLNFLKKYKFTKTTRFQMSSGGEGGNRGPYSHVNSICYKSNDCPTSASEMPSLAYTAVHLEFDLESSPVPYVHIITVRKNNKHEINSVGHQKMVCPLAQEGVDKIIIKLRFDEEHNHLHYGC